MEEKIFKLVERFLEELKKDLKENLLALAVYGSFARGDYKKTSDLDLIIILKKCSKSPNERASLILPAILRTRETIEYKEVRKEGFFPDFSPIIYQEDELAKTPSIFIDACFDSVIVYDTGVLKNKFEKVRRKLKELGAKRVDLGDGKRYWVLKPDLKPGEVFEI